MQRSKHFFLVAALTIFSVGISFASAASAPPEMTPLLLAVADAPIPFHGSDGRVHLVYELQMTNFSSGDAALQKVEIMGDGTVLQTLDTATIGRRLQPAGERQSTSTLTKGSRATLFLHVILPPNASAPEELSHRVAGNFTAAPPGKQAITETGGKTVVDNRAVAKIGPPLRGDGYISADSCCDAVRHTRAALPVNGRIWVAQRYAVDWEQLNDGARIYAGPREKLQSYAIFGKPVLAVADSVVDSVTADPDEQTPGKYPTNITLAAADGNCVILKLGEHQYALYAHMQPGSILVHEGQKVKRGETIGLVGNTGNSVAPHLHFQMNDGPSPMASNGLPYEIGSFEITGETLGTEAFDKAESEGTVVEIKPVAPPRRVENALPLDQLVISFKAQ